MTVLPFAPPSRRRGPRKLRTVKPPPPPKARSPWLEPLFRSRTQGELLALVLVDPEIEWSRDSLRRVTHASPATIVTELRRGVQAGILTERTGPRGTLMYRANPDHDVFHELRIVLLATFAPRSFY